MTSSLETILTRHARARMQQRGIPPGAIEELLAFGREHHDRHGGVVVSFDRDARRRLERATGARHAGRERLKKIYAVVTDGVIATVGHRTRRLRRH